MQDWDVSRARQTYNTVHWSGGYFDINTEGRVVARPRRAGEGIDLYALTEALREQGVSLPVLVRFLDILHDRVDSLCAAFSEAMRSERYEGRYTAVYPIKVNQQRRVVEEILARNHGQVGLEAGSKPELMAVLGLIPAGGTVICNGYKDREYVRLALLGQQLGYRVHIVVEKLSEIELVIREARALGVEPLLGLRLRLASIGAGKWQNTGGEKSKFGLTASQALTVVERLREAGMLESLQLLHFHLGSQIPNIRDIQRGMREAARSYAELRHLGVPIATVDVGGGLGVDYEGTRSRSYCSINYTLAEYASNVVYALREICQQQALPQPDIISESGRALTAHHAVLITNVIDYDRTADGADLQPPAADAPLILKDLWHGLREVAARSPVEAWHDAAHWLSEAQAMYTHGVLSLAQRAQAERIYQATCHAVRPRLDPHSRAHRELLDELNDKLADKLFCNFSLFQSMPDAWAIDQIFPILPLQRLDEAPTSRAVLQDLTCDSDGTIGGYVDRDGVESTLALPEYRPGEPYLLGMFMVGAYQEILGDMHNLFGDTDSVNVRLSGDGYEISDVRRGDTVDAVLRYVHFDAEDLLVAYRERVAAAPLDEARKAECLRELEEGLRGYTYLED
ncbi:biosynthetic arginine decarboxylase [Alkalilimnicola sp. S0819]|uniref:biosynthetic arginine decarboxylase n=1 Tax=Alkalilimnicola sp. S0819 TaxID=2613922 RepID=UPI0012626CBF|nr:biosynthetic arginine decarboxylase [Alkalilimnicola sp. S0819]KAB7623983.1 biosynthetic arginine decarboxylase [Alkalilimnicola sp. S0819]MPQ16587.1 biosynthetic arginine decarboxylase [Alkalilimnicola sp. S0819]